MNETKTILVSVRGTQYPIIVGSNVDKELVQAVQKKQPSRVALLSDTAVGALYGSLVSSWLTNAGFSVDTFFFEGGEQRKTQATVSDIQDDMLAKQHGRDSLVLALGGGVVGDIAGYVAATYMRGIPYIQIPTTILAMVDSSIGGKVGVDTPRGKNMIGAFWQPEAVIADIQFLHSLDRIQIVSGILEAVKCFISADADALHQVEKISLDNPLSTGEELQEVIARAASFKAGVIQRDEREENERRILNFGHTVGHALELLSQYRLPHGFAVGYGMLVETKIAEEVGVLSSSDRSRVVQYLAQFGIHEEALREYAVDAVLNAMKGDKKTKAGSIYCVLLNSVGSVLTKDGQYAHKVEESVIQRAYQGVVNNA